MPEAPLVSCIVEKVQERYLSKPALDRLRKAMEEEQERMKPRPRDLKRLKAAIAKLDAKIEQGAGRVFEAPPEIVPALYRKLEEVKAERDRLNAELKTASRAEAKSDEAGAEIDRAMKAMKNLSKALRKARPEDTRELLRSMVTKIELFYEHGETASGRKTSKFSHGIVYLRPDAGEGRSSDPKSTMMSRLGRKSRTELMIFCRQG